MSTKPALSVLSLPVLAAGLLTASRFVKPNGTAAGADDNALGVATTDAAVGDLVAVKALGTAVVEAGAAISAGDTVKADAQGRAIPWETAGARLGIALEAAAAAGQLIEVFLIPNAA
jgi:hypothetical protein